MSTLTAATDQSLNRAPLSSNGDINSNLQPSTNQPDILYPTTENQLEAYHTGCRDYGQYTCVVVTPTGCKNPLACQLCPPSYARDQLNCQSAEILSNGFICPIKSIAEDDQYPCILQSYVSKDCSSNNENCRLCYVRDETDCQPAEVQIVTIAGGGGTSRFVCPKTDGFGFSCVNEGP